MRNPDLVLLFTAVTLVGCSDPPAAPPPPVDVVIVYDIVPIDRPGDRPPVFEDRGPSDVSTDRGPERCAMSSFVPCECAPGVTGLRRCQPSGMLETTCHCDGFDAGPGDVTTGDGAVNDAGAADAPTGDAVADTPSTEL